MGIWKRRKQEPVTKKPETISAKITERKKYSRPHICCFDLEEADSSLISEAGYTVFSGSLGPCVRVKPNYRDGVQCLPNFDIPKNLHEYDILIFDLNSNKIIDYNPKHHTREYVTSSKSYFFLCSHPKTIFDPRPYTGSLLAPEIRNLQNRDSIVIVFADQLNEIEYEIVEDSGFAYQASDSLKHNNYSFLLDHLEFLKNKHGTRFVPNTKSRYLGPLLKKYFDQMEYHLIFYHPTIWKVGANVPREDFVPLLYNDDGEIVSFLKISDKQRLYVFPDIKEKGKFLKELFEEVLPGLIPELFPDHQMAFWTEEEEYFLPNTRTLLEERSRMLAKHEQEIEGISRRIEENTAKYNFLHRMLIETGDILVDHVKFFLEWLGFKNIVVPDDEALGLKEEDLSIEIDEGLLVIEVKGIGGTSKDEDCAQISKIRSRRCEARDTFDVYALYIVNHQRHLPPLGRKNPPFTETQINDASNEKRGLTTTWDLFNLYFNIEAGVISKESARKDLLQYGLINFDLDRVSFLGEIEEIYNNGSIGIIKDVQSTLDLVRTVFLRSGDRYQSIEIESIQVNDVPVMEAEEGEVGIKVNSKLRPGDRLYIAK